jgi:hypothetical protein
MSQTPALIPDLADALRARHARSDDAWWVTYNSTREDQWRCERYVMCRPPMLVWLVAPPAVVCVLAAFLRPPAGIMAGLIAAAYGGWLSLLVGATWLAVAIQTLGGRRICTCGITRDGLTEVTPSSRLTLPWRQVRRIDCHEGNTFFYVNAITTIYLSQTVFDDAGHARLFYEQAEAWRRGAGGTA